VRFRAREILADLAPLAWDERLRWVRGLLRRDHACGRKVRLPTRAAAERARQAMEAKHPGHLFDVYSCPWCGSFHLGHTVRRRR
jgi:hypothetical protein